VRVSYSTLAALLPIVLPLDVYLADACIRLVGSYATQGAVHLQEVLYVLGSLFSAVQDAGISRTIIAATSANATISQLYLQDLQYYRQQQNCNNITQYYSLVSLPTPQGYPAKEAINKCLCSGVQSSGVTAGELYNCVGQWMLPVVLSMSSSCGANPLQWCEQRSGYVCGRAELDGVGRFKVGTGGGGDKRCNHIKWISTN
jgi:hypothetical protein